ncbi:uncharacterized protein BP01DRAFT_355879 [Aspergillus saccharolyticus JOP 1030-1]|uniref:Uncharacterized protein n=1 Tax=Aspergillus saccharolyticus JOP 1030-1 TaxID=1450539 RepID=A0A318ZGV8_9EURO|nr:hypothetical protein BP01DRAFT_355879 [Aspergillus saccharolyticus JOP 1030-1]PYH46215.1 hypothetical protein BP01DRAFT_355879 [Aspergillus saccharolyticus JOP 1030-1]
MRSRIPPSSDNRKAITCAADDTIEPPHSVVDSKGNRVLIIDGMDHTHQCKDSELLWKAVRESEAQSVDLALVKDTISHSDFVHFMDKDH